MISFKSRKEKKGDTIHHTFPHPPNSPVYRTTRRNGSPIPSPSPQPISYERVPGMGGEGLPGFAPTYLHRDSERTLVFPRRFAADFAGHAVMLRCWPLGGTDAASAREPRSTPRIPTTAYYEADKVARQRMARKTSVRGSPHPPILMPIEGVPPCVL